MIPVFDELLEEEQRRMAGKAKVTDTRRADESMERERANTATEVRLEDLTEIPTGTDLVRVEPAPLARPGGAFENIAALVERTTTLPENARRVTKVLDFMPAGDRMLVQRVSSRRTQTPGGLYIPPTAQDLDQFCEIIRVGPKVGKVLFPDGTKRRPRTGDWVFIWAGAGMKLDMHREEFLIVTTEEALGYVEVETSEGGPEGRE